MQKQSKLFGCVGSKRLPHDPLTVSEARMMEINHAMLKRAEDAWFSASASGRQLTAVKEALEAALKLPDASERIVLYYPFGNWMSPHAIEVFHKAKEIALVCPVNHLRSLEMGGSILILFNAQEIISEEIRSKYKKVLVIHASDLPKNRGWSPYIYSVIDGENAFPVTLLEAADKVDSGPIYAQEWVTLEGHELLPEIREKIGKATVKAVYDFILKYPNVEARPQTGKGNYCLKRTPKDSALQLDRTLGEQFNLLRTVDNDSFPAFFETQGHRYELTIKKTA